MRPANRGSASSTDRRDAFLELAAVARLNRVIAHCSDALSQSGIESIVLKGPAHARLLYSEGGSRRYRDADLLVCPRDLDAAGRVLGSTGFQCVLDERHAEGLAPEPHGQRWRRSGDGTEVDLHWRLPGVALDPERAWSLLVGDAEQLPVGGLPVRVLSPSARALHVAIHAAQHGRSFDRPMAELEQALDQLNEETWQAAADLASRLEATPALAAGLRLSPMGQPLSERLGIAAVTSRQWEALSSSPPPGTFPLLRITTARGLGAKARSVGRSLAPPAAFMRGSFPLARRGPRGLAAAYGLRALRTIRHLPAAWQTVRYAAREEIAAEASETRPAS